MAGGRWDPRLRGAAHTPDEAPDVDDDPPEVHCRERITALEQEHCYPETGPDRKRAIDRELTYWRRQLEQLDRGRHWSQGEGDRTLF